jgi:hypothetical protein
MKAVSLRIFQIDRLSTFYSSDSSFKLAIFWIKAMHDAWEPLQ